MLSALRIGVLIVAVTISPDLAFPQSQFVGRWQTKASAVTKKSNLTVNIVERDGKIGGSVTVVNPDRSEITWEVAKPEIVSSRAVRFATEDRAGIIVWTLTLRGGVNARRASLRGSDRRPGKFGSGGEMLITEELRRRQ